jgi:hypothetical protein
VILAGIILTMTNVAAIWAWRLAEVSLENARRNGHAEFLRANKLAKKLQDNQLEIQELKSERLHDASLHADQLQASRNKAHRQEEYIHQLKNQLGAYQLDTLTKTEWRKQIDGLQNEIDGLNVDKLHLKSELAKYRAIHEKRKAQKAANMRRFRAKQKEAKG